MKSKKIISSLLSLAFIATTTTNVSATQITSIDETPYQETGQIILDNLYLDVVNENLVYQPKTRSIEAIEQQEILENEFEKDPDFEDRLIETLKDDVYDGKTIVAIGYTRVFLKEETTNGINHLQPMTIHDMENTPKTRAGSPATKGRLTLSTVVAIDNWDRTIATCYGYADWSSGWFDSAPDKVDSSNDDFMAVSQSSNFYLSSDSLTGASSDGYRNAKAFSSVVYGFREAKGRTALGTVGKQQSTGGYREWVTQYVHTWEHIAPSFSISTTGVTISGTPTDKSWQLAAYVNY